ncbi:hypothetical protein [Bradyrhizobium sp. URHC0002]
MTEQSFDTRASSSKEKNACALLPGQLAALFSFQHAGLTAPVEGTARIWSFFLECVFEGPSASSRPSDDFLAV